MYYKSHILWESEIDSAESNSTSSFKKKKTKNVQSHRRPYGSKYWKNGVDFDVQQNLYLGLFFGIKCTKTSIMLRF